MKSSVLVSLVRIVPGGALPRDRHEFTHDQEFFYLARSKKSEVSFKVPNLRELERHTTHCFLLVSRMLVIVVMTGGAGLLCLRDHRLFKGIPGFAQHVLDIGIGLIWFVHRYVCGSSNSSECRVSNIHTSSILMGKLRFQRLL
ncbi:hypothetical protein K501DRAFT_267041 [Backusella circina FSU 941]|nr:hypothetical protein K501DRAFT_267041 [Backusella circina FSU 941]